MTVFQPRETFNEISDSLGTKLGKPPCFGRIPYNLSHCIERPLNGLNGLNGRDGRFRTVGYPVRVPVPGRRGQLPVGGDVDIPVLPGGNPVC